METIFKEGISAREKLTMFWHNHFPIQAVQDPRYIYRYITLLRRYAWGNFRELVKEITIDPAMLTYLNGNFNTKSAPNENYARELLELFTIGKGPLAGPGDYTNYTEQDIKEIARILSGWRDVGFLMESEDGKIGVEFRPWKHDSGTKQLSHRFDNIKIPNLEDREYAFLIDLIFQQPEVARFICRKLYRWFVYYQIDEQVESTVINSMAQLLIENDFEVKPVLRALLGSAHFFDSLYLGAMIKHPVDFVMSAIKPFGLASLQDPEQLYNRWYTIFGQAQHMQMELFSIPQVAGWRAYYLSPVYYRDWISATTLPIRMEFVENLAKGGLFPYQSGPRIRIYPLLFLARLNAPADPNALIQELTKLLFPKPVTPEVQTKLKETLIPGLPDFEWTIEYNRYLRNPSDTQLARAVEAKLRNLIHQMFSMAEFQLS